MPSYSMTFLFFSLVCKSRFLMVLSLLLSLSNGLEKKNSR